MENTTALAEYRQASVMTETMAEKIIRSIPGNERAPQNVVQSLAIKCAIYKLYPGTHLYLVPYRNREGGYSWNILKSIDVDRLYAARKKAFVYVDRRPLSDQEAEHIFSWDYDPKKGYAICVLEGKDGTKAIGYGSIGKAETIHGLDKGNTRSGMAMIRAERQALRMLCPGEIPEEIDQLDSTSGEYLPQYSDVNVVTGEIVDEPVEGNKADAEANIEEGVFADEEETPTVETDIPDPGSVHNDTEDLFEEEPQPKPPKQTANVANPKGVKPKNYKEICLAAFHVYGMDEEAVAVALKNAKPTKPSDCYLAWLSIVEQFKDQK